MLQNWSALEQGCGQMKFLKYADYFTCLTFFQNLYLVLVSYKVTEDWAEGGLPSTWHPIKSSMHNDFKNNSIWLHL